MKIILKVGLIVSAASLLAACGKYPSKYNLFKNHSNDYLMSKSVPPLTIPPGDTSNTVEPYYTIPPARAGRPTKPVALLPPNINPKDKPPPLPWYKVYLPDAHMPWQAAKPKDDE